LITMFILKIGGSVLSDKNKKYDFSEKNLRSVARELFEFWKNDKEKFILVIGAGSVGHSLVKDYSLLQNIDPMANCKSSAKFDEYFDKVRNILIEEGLPVFSIRTSNVFYIKKNGIEGDLTLLRALLKNNIIPMFSADFCTKKKTKTFSIVSADDISAFLAKKMKAKKLIMITNVDGVYADIRRRNLIREMSKSKLKKIKTKKKRFDFTGGIKRKVKVLLKLRGVESIIVNGTKRGELLKALRGEDVGTKIKNNKRN